MDRQILNITANEQILTVDEPIRISTNKVNYIEAHFTLGDNWSGYDSIRAIWYNDFNCISTVLDSLGNCAVPFEVMKRKGNVKVNLVGSISEDDVLTDRLTSYPVVAVIVDCTAQITGANTQPITPSEYEQFVAAVHEDAERAEQGASNAETSAQNAHASEQNASQSAQSAHDDKIAIEEAIAEVIQQIEDFEQVQVVVNTLPPSSQATSDFTDGVLTLGIPQGVKGDTGNGIQNITKTGTSGLVDTYTITFTDGQTTTFTVTNGAKGDTGNGIQSIAKTSTVGLVDTYTITYTNGTTTTFTVTNGEKGDKGDTGEVSLSELEDATVVQTLSDTEPYHFRQTNAGQGCGHKEYDEIVGGSVGWNQLVPIPSTNTTKTTNGITFTDNRDGSYSISGTATANAYSANLISHAENVLISGHKYICMGIGTGVQFTDAWNATITFRGESVLVYNNPNKMRVEMALLIGSGNTVNSTVKPNIVDLTLFNSQIADYVYTLEQSTAGSGVTWLKTHFPKLFDTYQPYDSGSIKSVSGLTAHEMVGVNLFDKNTSRYIYVNGRISAGDVIYAMQTTDSQWNLYIAYEDGTQTELALPPQSKRSVSITKAVNRIAVTDYAYEVITSQNAELMVSLSDFTEAEPYIKHTYPLDSSVELRGQYKFDANNNLYAVGDVYKASGEIGRNYAEITFDGSEAWRQVSGQSVFYAIKDDMDYAWKSNVCAMTLKYVFYGTRSSGYSNMSDKEFLLYYSGGSIIHEIAFRDNSVADVAAWKTKLQNEPITVLYEKQTPTTEQATPYTSPQWCDSHGTEEYVGSELPCGHSTDYPMSLVDTMDGLGDGSYTPKLTITNGVKTITWQNV